ncbi:MAG: hypothetical protein JXQ71_08545 [Verrucomicrobia bacterium]|nr:hypothetical protein [Verrucomicrobiota bacterium]
MNHAGRSHEWPANSRGFKPQYTHEEFVAAGQSQFKRLPPGWKFRVKTLDRDLNEKREGGMATINGGRAFLRV